MNKLKNISEKTLQWILASVLVVLVIITLIVKIDRSDRPEDNQNNNEEEQTSETMQEGEADVTPEPFSAEGFDYQFTGIDWDFADMTMEGGPQQTQVRMWFADFTRNGNMVNFSKPYKLGIYPGTCSEVSYLETPIEEGIPVGYAQCTSAESTREFAVLQQMQTMNFVTRLQGQEWEQFFELDMTQEVR